MLPKANRLKHKTDFARVLENGSKVRTAHLLFFVTPSPTEQFRLGVVVSKKVSKKAVTRNGIRRVLSEIFRPSLPTLPPSDVVILVSRDPGDNRYAIFQEEIAQWQRKLS